MSQATDRAFQLEVREGIAVLTFDLPGSKANTLGRAVVAELAEIVAQLKQRSDLKGLVLRSGKPGMFIAGADLRELGAARPDPEVTRALVRSGLEVFATIEALPCPTVAAIEGPCVGGGLELALAFDFRVASKHPKTELGLVEVKVGLIPGLGGTQRLPRIIGPATAVQSAKVFTGIPWMRQPSAPSSVAPTRPPYQVIPSRAKSSCEKGVPVRRCTSTAK